MVKPNRRELEIWAGRKLPELSDVVEAAHALRDQGIAHVVISLGAEGALWVNASGAWIAKPPACEVVSTVGAGDSMVGGLIYGLLMRESSERRYVATAVAALAVDQSNVGVTDRPQLAAMMARGDLKPLSAEARMKTLLMIDSSLGQARSHLAKNLPAAAVAKAGHQLVEQAADAEIVIVAGETVPNDATLTGKNIYTGDVAAAVREPEAFI